jgi:DNA-binding CsgD family transcriptional regulator
MIILFFFLLPFFIIQALTPKHSFIHVPEILKQISVPSLMVFYICINITIIILYLNYLHQLSDKLNEIPDFNLKKYVISDREKEVIELLYKGYSTRKIGEKLFIAFGTVKTHIHKIYQKTDSHNKIELFSKLYTQE